MHETGVPEVIQSKIFIHHLLWIVPENTSQGVPYPINKRCVVQMKKPGPARVAGTTVRTKIILFIRTCE